LRLSITQPIAAEYVGDEDHISLRAAAARGRSPKRAVIVRAGIETLDVTATPERERADERRG
jgi:hypothetical protein